jgi:hypothetical protein
MHDDTRVKAGINMDGSLLSSSATAGPLVGLTPEQVTQVIGTLDPLRAVRAERVYVRAFFDFHLRHQNDHLFGGASPRYPEIQFVR